MGRQSWNRFFWSKYKLKLAGHSVAHRLFRVGHVVVIAFFSLFVVSTVASGLNALAAVTVEDFAPLVVQHIPTEREALVSKLLGIG